MCYERQIKLLKEKEREPKIQVYFRLTILRKNVPKIYHVRYCEYRGKFFFWLRIAQQIKSSLFIQEWMSRCSGI